MADPVVVEVLVADCEALADVVRDRGLGGGHAERVEDATADDLGVRSAVDRLEHQAERLVADVRVVEPLAGRRRRRQVAQRPDLEGRLGRGVDPGDDARGVRQQVRDGDRRRAGGLGNGEPRQVLRDGRVKVERPLVSELQRGHRRECLPDRADLEERLGHDRDARLELGVAVRPEGERAVAVRDGERETRLCAALDRGERGHVHGFDEARLRHASIVLPPLT